MKNLLYLIIFIVLCVSLVFSTAIWYHYLELVHNDKLELTRGVVITFADEFASQTNHSGSFDRIDHQDFNDYLDPWGNKLHRVYFRDAIKETLKISSNGPDGVRNTTDDILEIRESILQ